jgi:hypothetical protein
MDKVIPRATHDIIDMLAPLRRHRTRITSAETEFGSRHEVLEQARGNQLTKESANKICGAHTVHS